MKKRNYINKIAAMALALVFIFALTPAITVQGASANGRTNTITFRPGSAGEGFTQEFIGRYRSITGFEIEENINNSGTLRITVPRGTSVSRIALPQVGDVVHDSEYFFLGMNGGFRGAATITRNVDFVAAYGRLVNGVEYTVSFVEIGTGVPVRSPIIAFGNIGASSSEYQADLEIDTSDFGLFRLISQQFQSIPELSADASRNTLVFQYENIFDPGTETVTLPGETVTEVVDVVVPGTPPGDDGVAVLPDDDTPLAPPPGEDTIELPVETPPLAGPDGNEASEDGEDQGITEIEEPETPTAEAPYDTERRTWIFWTILALVAAAGFTGAAAYRNRRLKSDET